MIPPREWMSANARHDDGICTSRAEPSSSKCITRACRRLPLTLVLLVRSLHILGRPTGYRVRPFTATAQLTNLPGLHALADLLPTPFGDQILFGVVYIEAKVGDGADPYDLDREDKFFGDTGKRNQHRLVGWPWIAMPGQ